VAKIFPRSFPVIHAGTALFRFILKVAGSHVSRTWRRAKPVEQFVRRLAMWFVSLGRLGNSQSLTVLCLKRQRVLLLLFWSEVRYHGFTISFR